jgi:rare lipoprotein A
MAQNRAARRRVEVAALSLALGAAGCRHKSQTIAYQPPPAAAMPAASSSGAGKPRPTHADSSASASAPGTAASAPQPEAHGKPVSTEVGVASWYGPPYNNHKGADGTVYDQNAMTAAHRELPMGSIVRVTNLNNDRSVMVRITDRGPFVDGRIIDLSLAAARAVDLYRPGTARVRVEAYAPPAGADPAGKWCVQIGAFLDPAASVRLKNELTRRYSTAKVIEFAGPTGHWVRISPQDASKAVANRIAGNIHLPDRAAQPYLVRLN